MRIENCPVKPANRTYVQTIADFIVNIEEMWSSEENSCAEFCNSSVGLDETKSPQSEFTNTEALEEFTLTTYP